MSFQCVSRLAIIDGSFAERAVPMQAVHVGQALVAPFQCVSCENHENAHSDGEHFETDRAPAESPQRVHRFEVCDALDLAIPMRFSPIVPRDRPPL